MSIINQTAINVFNYNEFIVCATTQLQGYDFAPASDGVPSMHPMSFVEIQYINGKSDAFRTGLLRFAPNKEVEVYKALNINDWNNIITNEFIEDAILNPTKENLQRLVDINSTSVFDRVKTILTRLINSREHDISNRVINTLEARERELRHGIYKSEIIIKPKAKNKEIPNEEVNELKAQLAEMQKMMAQLMNQKPDASKDEGDDGTDEQEDENEEVATKPKRGRPANRSK